MNVLLIRPKPDKETIGLQNVMICEPLELEYVASLIEGEGHRVFIADMILEKRSLKRILKDFQPDIAGMTAYITHVHTVKSYARQIKALLPQCKTAVGGVHAEVVPEDFQDTAIDYILESSSLKTFRDLISGLEQGVNGFTDLHGLWSENNPPCIKEDTFDYPWPDREKMKQYRHRYYYMFHNPCALMKTSFGCPYPCNFCFCRQITGGRYYTRALHDVVNELAAIKEQEVYIVDDNFLVDRDRVLSFCREIKERKLDKRFLIYGRADFIAQNPDVIKEFAEVGLQAVIVGLESSSQEELDKYNKHSSLAINEKAVSILKAYGVECYATLILGLDWDEQRFLDLKNWLKKLGLIFVNLQPFTPLPGTPLFDEYREQLIVSRQQYSKWDLAHVTVKPDKMSTRRYYWNIIKLYYAITMNPASIAYLVKKYGWKKNLKLSYGAFRITLQYLRKVLVG